MQVKTTASNHELKVVSRPPALAKTADDLLYAEGISSG
jgi:hypothetical protein